MSAYQDFVPLKVAVLTVSDSRTLDNDSSGDILIAGLEAEVHANIARIW